MVEWLEERDVDDAEDTAVCIGGEEAMLAESEVLANSEVLASLDSNFS